jgi:hypothetical protein
MVRGMAVWALRELLPPDEFIRIADERAPLERDEDVAAEYLHEGDSGP